MHGNVWEWVWAGYRADHENRDPVYPVHDVEPGAFRVIRGGNWVLSADRCRCADRYFAYPRIASGYFGFRVVRTAF
jgi:formylglycine-generating enzyme required for sulfatase activity